MVYFLIYISVIGEKTPMIRYVLVTIWFEKFLAKISKIKAYLQQKSG